MRWLELGLVAATAIGVLGCGAKTGLRRPDTGVLEDAIDVRDVSDVGDVCMQPRLELTRRPAEVMFVIDRSNSMRWDLMGMDTMGDLELSRWAILRNALRTALPPFEATLAMGATVFPGVQRPNSPIEEACSAPANIDLRPVRNNSQPIIQLFRTTQPGGGTPTFGGLQVTANFLQANQTRGVPQYIVLATDGGPNCNATLDARVCACTSRGGMPPVPNCAPMNDAGVGNVWNCLDDTRTVTEVTRIASMGIPVFVIGIDDVTRPDLTQVLNEMAVAGSRPNMRPGQERYYSVRQPADLTDAFTAIQRTIAQCSFVTPGMQAGPDRVTIEANGVEVPRDPGRMNGWDWSDRAIGEVTLFGPACEMVVSMRDPRIVALLPCQ